jgi:hypothetical protein
MGCEKVILPYRKACMAIFFFDGTVSCTPLNDVLVIVQGRSKRILAIESSAAFRHHIHTSMKTKAPTSRN